MSSQIRQRILPTHYTSMPSLVLTNTFTSFLELSQVWIKVNIVHPFLLPTVIVLCVPTCVPTRARDMDPKTTPVTKLHRTIHTHTHTHTHTHECIHDWRNLNKLNVLYQYWFWYCATIMCDVNIGEMGAKMCISLHILVNLQLLQN